MAPGQSPRPLLSRRWRYRTGAVIYAAIVISLVLCYWARAPPLEGKGLGKTKVGNQPGTREVIDVAAQYEQDARDIKDMVATWPKGKPKAAIFMLARNSEARDAAMSLLELETSFNSNTSAQYPYIIVNNAEFTPTFIGYLTSSLRGRCFFGKVPEDHWSYPPHVDQKLVRGAMASQVAAGVFHGGEESYHFMCRYFSGFFMLHPLLEGFDYYWRVEPAVHFFCRLPRDPFQFMQTSSAMYGWNIVRPELMNTIPSLWNKVVEFLEENPSLLHPNNSLATFVKGSKIDWAGHASPAAALSAVTYNGCHFWSNFEIGDLAFFRGEAYQRLFRWLDSTGGYFLERWGDAPMHTLAVASLLDGRAGIHHFDDVGYRHDDAMHCPQDPGMVDYCDCMPTADFHLHNGVCYRPLVKAGLVQRRQQHGTN